MTRLNIPMNSKKTARHKRRAVWNTIGFIVLFLLGCVLIHNWFTRDTLAAYAPTDTQTIIRLTPTKNTWPVLLDRFSFASLLNNGLSLQSIAPYVHGELSIFIQENGDRSLAFHGELPESVKQAFLAHGLAIGEPNSSIVTINTEPNERADLKHKLSLLNRIDPRTIGQIIKAEQDQTTVFPIKLTNKGIDIKLGKLETSSLSSLIPHDSVLAAEIPASMQALAYLNSVPSLLLDYLESSGGQVVLMLNQETGLQGISLSVNHQIPNDELIQLHRYLASYSDPGLTTKTLDDSTRLAEIVSDTESVQISESTLGNATILNSDRLTTMSESNKTLFTIISQSEGPFQSISIDVSTECITKPIITSDPTGLLIFLQTSNLIHTNIYNPISTLSSFVQVGLDKEGRMNTFRVCF